MKKTLILITIFSVILAMGIYGLLNLTDRHAIIQAKYQMLACEKCYHMDVIRSDIPDLVAKTIIPKSSSYDDIEKLISDSLETKQDLCLEGYTYFLNVSTWWIDPPGIAFRIDKSHPIAYCDKLQAS